MMYVLLLHLTMHLYRSSIIFEYCLERVIVCCTILHVFFTSKISMVIKFELSRKYKKEFQIPWQFLLYMFSLRSLIGNASMSA